MAGYLGQTIVGVSSGSQKTYTFTATASQTTFSGVSYIPKQLEVYQNGVRLVDGVDYSATDGNTIVLSEAASENDSVVITNFTTFDVADTYSQSESDVRYVNVTSGTTMPVSPSLGDEVYRTDLETFFKYNGSVWMEL